MTLHLKSGIGLIFRYIYYSGLKSIFLSLPYRYTFPQINHVLCKTGGRNTAQCLNNGLCGCACICMHAKCVCVSFFKICYIHECIQNVCLLICSQYHHLGSTPKILSKGQTPSNLTQILIHPKIQYPELPGPSYVHCHWTDSSPRLFFVI